MRTTLTSAALPVGYTSWQPHSRTERQQGKGWWCSISTNFLGTTDAVDLVVKTGGTDKMRVKSGGNVGIGITSPSVLLHLQATAASGNGEPLARFTVSDADNSERLIIGNRSTADAEFAGEITGFSNATDYPSLTLRGYASDDSGTQPVMLFVARDADNIATRPVFSWKGQNVNYMQMDAGGNLGIGTTTPSGRLDVNGTVFVSSIPAGSMMDSDLGFDGNGQLVDLSSSTIEFKENVEDIQFDKEGFLNLRPVDFKWRDFYGGGLDVGLIAQEVHQTFPELAIRSYKRTYLPNGDMVRDSLGIPVVDSTQTEVRGVRYHKLPVYLLALAKYQQEELNELRSQLQELTDRLDGCCASVEPMNRLSDEETQEATTEQKKDEFILLRNDPNPFNDYTDIQYDHEDCASCEIVIVDMVGRIVKRIKISGSKGVVRIYSSELGSGMFVYSLLKDGSVIRSETMVSSKQ